MTFLPNLSFGFLIAQEFGPMCFIWQFRKFLIMWWFIWQLKRLNKRCILCFFTLKFFRPQQSLWSQQQIQESWQKMVWVSTNCVLADTSLWNQVTCPLWLGHFLACTCGRVCVLSTCWCLPLHSFSLLSLFLPTCGCLFSLLNHLSLPTSTCLLPGPLSLSLSLHYTAACLPHFYFSLC